MPFRPEGVVSGKADMTAALEGCMPQGAVPFWEIHFHCWSKFSDREFISGKPFLELPESEREAVLQKNAEIMLEVAPKLGYSGVTVPDGPWDCPYTLPVESRLRLARILKDHSPDFLVVGGQGGVIQPPGNSEQYLEFAYRLSDAPGEVDEMVKSSRENGIVALQTMQDAGVDVVYVAADFCDNHGPFFNPEQMERWILPSLSALAEHGRKIGMYVLLHCDGDLHPVLEDIAQTGLHGVQAIDPTANMDIARACEQVAGRMCLCGNVNCATLESDTPEAVYDNTGSILNACKDGGRLILGASNAVVGSVSKENYSAQVQAWRDHGAYGEDKGYER